MIYFKAIEQNVKRIARELQNTALSTEERSELKQRYEALQELLNFIRKGTWISTKDGYNRVMDTLRLGIKGAADKYNCSENTIRVGLSKASAKVETLIGADVLPEITEGDVGLALYRYKRNTKQLKNVLLNDAFADMQVPVETDKLLDDYSLNDCKPELAYMMQYSIPRMQKQRKNISEEKLAYLYTLLSEEQEEDEAVHKQQQLYSYLCGNTTERR